METETKIALVWDYSNDCWRAYEYDAVTNRARSSSYTLGKRDAAALVADGVAHYEGGE
jgi:hypothetical protein